MANSILKWCKSKFLNGYRHINVEASEEMCGNRSDTETLVRGSEKEFVLTTPTPSHSLTPMLSKYGCLESSSIHHRQWDHHQDTTNGHTTPYLEEVTCDLSITGGSTEHQEFAFTLYDFDGHGRVTKDDIAGLVQTIYETVGSSLSLPPCGSRTIRVKLTVSPHSTHTTGLRFTETNTASTTPKESPRNTGNESCSPRAYINDCSPRTTVDISYCPRTIKDDKCSPRSAANDSYSPRTVQNGSCSPRTVANDSFSPRAIINEPYSPRSLLNESSSSPGESPRTLDDDNSPTISPRKDEGIEVSPRTPRRDSDLYHRTPRKNEDGSPRRDYRRRRRRRSSFHRQELLQIIQANMEKNNLFYPPLHYRYHNSRRRRKNCGSCDQHCNNHCGSPPDPATLKARLLECECAWNSYPCCNNKCDVRNSCCRCCVNQCRRSFHNRNPNSKIRHNRSRSHDNSTDSPHVFRHHLLDNGTHQPLPPSNTPDRPTSPQARITHHHQHNHLLPHLVYHLRSRSCEANDSEECPPITLTHPFQRKTSDDAIPNNHKYRQHRTDEQHNRAMSQVVAWLERSSIKDNATKNNINTDIPDSADKLIDKTSDDNTANNNSNNCGLAHHVHQHYHHHYHHYPKAPSLII